VNYLEFPAADGPMRASSPWGKWFPTGAHKVGAAFGCLVPRLVTGQFDPTTQKAVWPSTGNYCRGGAYDSALLACQSIAILPEGMSKERFEWLSRIAGEVIKTPGSESNVKEIFDKCWELRGSGQDLMIFNQFEEFGTTCGIHDGQAMRGPGASSARRYLAAWPTTGSAGTTLRRFLSGLPAARSPPAKRSSAHAAQTVRPHRIEGIGDKHVPWIHNVRTPIW
jgi:cysteine synthase